MHHRSAFISASVGALALAGASGCLVGPPARFGAEPRKLAVTHAATDLEQLTNTPEHELDPSVSPDAARVAFSVVAKYGAPQRLEVLTLADGARVEVAAGRDLFGSPSWVDARHVAMGAKLRDDPYARGMIFDVDGRGPSHPLARAWTNVNTVSVSVAPAAPRFVQEVSADLFGWYSATRYDMRILVVTDVDGLSRVEFQDARSPSFSPDGRRIAYVGLGDRIYVGDATDGKALYYLMPGDAPSWSPDGRWIVFCAEGDDGGKDLFVVESGGGKMRALTRGTSEACHPAWSNDGWIYFHANAAGNFDVWRLRPRGFDTRL
jgi:hypothetical protein